MIERGRGNLLHAKVEALVNTVNTVGVMGKGIALQFKKAYPQNFEVYEQQCRDRRVDIGKMLTVETGKLIPKYIINFPTKRHWVNTSKLSYIEEGLTALVNEVLVKKIRSLAVPPLGCGNGGLEWSRVRPLIEQVFVEVPEVRVILFEPTE